MPRRSLPPLPKLRRLLLKISGEALMGDAGYGIAMEEVARIAADIRAVRARKQEVCLVIGGGNIYRGLAGAAGGMERSTADYMGMLATVMNALAMQNALEQAGVDTRVLSAIPMTSVCEPYVRRRALRHIEKERVVILAAGTGNPFFSTDTAAVLRAAELNCDVLLKGTKVDGVYSADPQTDKAATRYQHLRYYDVLEKDLRVMDMAAVSLARDNKIPILVFSIRAKRALLDVFDGKGKATLVH